MDTFKLGYEFVRDDIGMRREHLKRLAAEVIVKMIIKTTVMTIMW